MGDSSPPDCTPASRRLFFLLCLLPEGSPCCFAREEEGKRMYYPRGVNLFLSLRIQTIPTKQYVPNYIEVGRPGSIEACITVMKTRPEREFVVAAFSWDEKGKKRLAGEGRYRRSDDGQILTIDVMGAMYGLIPGQQTSYTMPKALRERMERDERRNTH